jgi:predicted metal-dependent HD superfamily phosphohydrolase
MRGEASGDLALFLDLDLAVLGGTPAAYARYAEQIRKEYAHVTHAAYSTGRTAAMTTFLTKGPLYFTESFREQLEARARENIQAELAHLARRCCADS